MKPTLWAIIATSLLLLVAGAPTDGSGSRVPDPVTLFGSDDPVMNAAEDHARRTVDVFVEAFRARAGEVFSVKFPFPCAGAPDTPRVEHMWVAVDGFDGERFSGTVDNTPECAIGIREGQTVTVSASEISDWMFLRGDIVHGGFTVRVMLRAADPAAWTASQQYFAPLPP